MTMHFDMADLRLMVRIADANSLTKGAEASHVSLPAASTRLKHIEESVGAKLFYRTSQGVTLTPPDTVIFDSSGMLKTPCTGGKIMLLTGTRADTLAVSIAGIIYKP